MPLYEYECDACGHRFEHIHQKFSDPPIDTCPKCGGQVHKLMSSPAIQFKGSGFYITDYAKKDSVGAGKPEGKSDAQSGTKGQSTSDAKTESKSDSKSETKGEGQGDTKSGAKAASSGEGQGASAKSPAAPTKSE